MAAETKLEQFQGPLDLLLQLIEGEEMTITDVSLSTVTEQFFSYLQTLEEKNPEELADFLVVASKLVFLKSKYLLPYLLPKEDEGPTLADQLKLYKRYADASKLVEKMWQENRVAYGRIEPPTPVEGFLLPLNATSGHLKDSLLSLLKRLKPVAPLPQVSIDRTLSVKQKIQSLTHMLNTLKRLDFSDIIKNATSRTEVIVSFLAILELVKSDSVTVEQSSAFENFVLKTS
jgi:segregation and condensation protein A